MGDNDRYLLDINKDNLTRVIGFAGTYDTKANFVLTIILAFTAYLIAELPTYIDAHTKHAENPWFALPKIGKRPVRLRRRTRWGWEKNLLEATETHVITEKYGHYSHQANFPTL